MTEIIVVSKDDLIAIIRQELSTIKRKSDEEPLEIMTVKEVCKYLKITPPTVSNRIKFNGLPVSYALGEKSPRFLKSEIDQWLKDRK